jgi:hypothetical protein
MVRRSLGCFQVLIGQPTMCSRRGRLGIRTMLSPELTEGRCHNPLQSEELTSNPSSETTGHRRHFLLFGEDFWLADPF